MKDVDIAKISEDWQSRNFSCGIWTDPPGQRWENFTHATDELVLVIQGEVEFEIAGTIYHPIIGQELLIPANAVHSVRNLGKRTARWLYGYKQL